MAEHKIATTGGFSYIDNDFRAAVPATKNIWKSVKVASTVAKEHTADKKQIVLQLHGKMRLDRKF